MIYIDLDYSNIEDRGPTLVDQIRTTDSENYQRWRYMQSLHYLALWKYAVGKSEYYIQLEDDVIATNDYLRLIRLTLDELTGSWYELSFCNLGYIGKSD